MTLPTQQDKNLRRQGPLKSAPVVGEVPGLLLQVVDFQDIQQAQHELVRVLHVRHEAKGAQHALLDAKYILLQVLEPLRAVEEGQRSAPCCVFASCNMMRRYV